MSMAASSTEKPPNVGSFSQQESNAGSSQVERILEQKRLVMEE